MPSTDTDVTAFVHRLHEEVWNQGNLDRIEELLAEDYVEHSSAHPGGLTGPDEYRTELEQLRAAFPDLSVTEQDTITEGNKVTSRLVFRGTHEGEFMDLPPTGEEVEFQAIAINRVEDGNLVEAWVQTDVMGLMQQLGVIEPPDG